MSEWIDVGTRCPEPEDNVLIAHGNSVEIGWQGHSGHWWQVTGRYHHDTVSGVTHWQPLPAHPNWEREVDVEV